MLTHRTPFLLPPLNISPFVLRELRLALRQQNAVRNRYIAALTVTGVTILLLAIFVLYLDFSPRKVGAFLNGFILIAALSDILITAPLGAQLFADERRNNTLGLIFSTGITGTEVLIGKLAALLIIPLSRLLTLAPCLMILPLMRAVTPQTCVAMITTILVLLALVLSIHLFASLVFEELSSARTFADIFTIVLLGLAPAINLLNTYFTGAALDRSWLCLSPALGSPRLLAGRHARLECHCGERPVEHARSRSRRRRAALRRSRLDPGEDGGADSHERGAFGNGFGKVAANSHREFVQRDVRRRQRQQPIS